MMCAEEMAMCTYLYFELPAVREQVYAINAKCQTRYEYYLVTAVSSSALWLGASE